MWTYQKSFRDETALVELHKLHGSKAIPSFAQAGK